MRFFFFGERDFHQIIVSGDTYANGGSEFGLRGGYGSSPKTYFTAVVQGSIVGGILFRYSFISWRVSFGHT